MSGIHVRLFQQYLPFNNIFWYSNTSITCYKKFMSYQGFRNCKNVRKWKIEVRKIYILYIFRILCKAFYEHSEIVHLFLSFWKRNKAFWKWNYRCSQILWSFLSTFSFCVAKGKVLKCSLIIEYYNPENLA